MGRPSVHLRLVVAAFGDPGHAFPAIALARELRRRGHEVLVETWEHWREAVEAEGLGFTGAQEYTLFPPPGPGTPDGETAAAAARALARLMGDFEPDLVISDIKMPDKTGLTPRSALIAELRTSISMAARGTT